MQDAKMLLGLLVACAIGFGAIGVASASPESEAAVREAAANLKEVNAQTIQVLDDELTGPPPLPPGHLRDSLENALQAAQALQTTVEPLLTYPN